MTHSGGDIVSTISKVAKKIGIPLKNIHLPGHNYTGPFTELHKRLDENDNPLPEFQPFNQIDRIAMHHDINYRKADKGEGTRHEADKIMLNELDAIKTKGIREKLDYAIVKPIIWMKHKLGLGIDPGEAEELLKPIRTKFKRRRVFVFNIDDIWSADLKDMQSFSKQNKGVKYLLTVIDLFSKYAYTIPLKSKNAEVVIEAFRTLFKTRRPNKLWTDQGSEFINRGFKKFLSENNIELYHVYNEGKANVIERFNRTLGEMIQKHMTTNQTTKYIDVLQNLLSEYNNKYHTSIKMTPFEASIPNNTEKVLNNLYSDIKPTCGKPKFKVGDRVRIQKYKNIFEKGYRPKWTTEIFIVVKVQPTNPVTYKIKDLSEEPILGSFYTEELQKTKF
jgi:transposase InsO family protein